MLVAAPRSDDSASQQAGSQPDSAAGNGAEPGGSAAKLTAEQRLRQFIEPRVILGTHQGDPYAKAGVNGHSEVFPLRHRDFLLWIRREYHAEKGENVATQVLAEVQALLESRARFEGRVFELFRRVGSVGDSRIYVDLGTPDRAAIRITPGCVELVRQPDEVLFVRPRGMGRLPIPDLGAEVFDVSALREFVNVGDGAEGDGRFLLLVVWLTYAFLPRGPFPILFLHGEQGSAKSCSARALKRLIDPSDADLRALPQNERDLMISARNTHCLVYDNLSGITIWLSDAFCRLSTGAAFATRTLHSDADETLFQATRPVVMTGIDEIATRGDLLSRCVSLELPRIEGRRRTEAELWSAFDAAAPRLLGALLHVVAGALLLLPGVAEPSAEIRLADFARFGQAVEQVLGLAPGVFLESLNELGESNSALAVESSLVGEAVQELVERAPRLPVEGTCKELLGELGKLNPDRAQAKSWPTNAKGLSSALKRLAPDLARTGIVVNFKGRTRHGRLLSLSKK